MVHLFRKHTIILFVDQRLKNPTTCSKISTKSITWHKKNCSKIIPTIKSTVLKFKKFAALFSLHCMSLKKSLLGYKHSGAKKQSFLFIKFDWGISEIQYLENCQKLCYIDLLCSSSVYFKKPFIRKMFKVSLDKNMYSNVFITNINNSSILCTNYYRFKTELKHM